MRVLVISVTVLLQVLFAACGSRDEAAKRNVPTPFPSVSPLPSSTPIDPKDVLAVDTTLEGDTISIDSSDLKKTVACTKFNRVLVNGDSNQINIKGGCGQITINGDGNEITIDAALEFVFNGSENRVRYSRLLNGKVPSVTENRPGNLIEKISAETKEPPLPR